MNHSEPSDQPQFEADARNTRDTDKSLGTATEAPGSPGSRETSPKAFGEKDLGDCAVLCMRWRLGSSDVLANTDRTIRRRLIGASAVEYREHQQDGQIIAVFPGLWKILSRRHRAARAAASLAAETHLSISTIVLHNGQVKQARTLIQHNPVLSGPVIQHAEESVRILSAQHRPGEPSRVFWSRVFAGVASDASKKVFNPQEHPAEGVPLDLLVTTLPSPTAFMSAWQKAVASINFALLLLLKTASIGEIVTKAVALFALVAGTVTWAFWPSQGCPDPPKPAASATLHVTVPGYSGCSAKGKVLGITFDGTADPLLVAVSSDCQPKVRLPNDGQGRVVTVQGWRCTADGGHANWAA